MVINENTPQVIKDETKRLDVPQEIPRTQTHVRYSVAQ